MCVKHDKINKKESVSDIMKLTKICFAAIMLLMICACGGENDSYKENTMLCDVVVECSTILNNKDALKEEKKGLVPEDGVIYKAQNVEFTEGESAFDVLDREIKKNKIHMEFETNPGGGSVYIKGINNIYEGDCGNLSGWIFGVNGKISDIDASGYTLNDGDTLAFCYTCDMGEDLDFSQF